ncbi:FMRFamide-related peptides type HF-4 [Zootermopsis nevadensis]|nr:FMRFamide-related peptides type HF-4 [Zootermopsis nevadensis]
MMRVMLALVCVAVAASYPTDTPISEQQNNELATPDDAGALGDDCEFEDVSPPTTKRRQEDEDKPAPVHRHCSSRIYLNLPEEEDTALPRLGRGGRPNYNFVRFGRGGKNDNFVRFGRGGKQDNFIRFGRDRSDNFVRLGRTRADNFIRFGRGKQENFIRFGRDKQGNFIRFGRGMKNSDDNDETFRLEDTDVNPENEFSASSNLRVGRSGKSEGDFIRFGRARPSNFIRLGRGDDDLRQPKEGGTGRSEIARYGRQTYDDNFVRLGRSPGNNDAMRRGKLTDRNFIRLGRSGPQNDYAREWENSEMSGRSDNPPTNNNFIRLGKRAKGGDERENFVRPGRDAEQTPGTENKTVKHTRNRRSATFSGGDENPEDSSDCPVVTSNSASDDDKIASAFEYSQIPFQYYSPLASGIPNYILGPLGNEDAAKGRKGGGLQKRHYIRLG